MGVDWEQRYQSLDTPWDKGEPSPGLLEFLPNHPLLGEILVVGCGYGRSGASFGSSGWSGGGCRFGSECDRHRPDFTTYR